MENLATDQSSDIRKKDLTTTFAETLKQEGFLKIHLPLMRLNDVSDEIDYYRDCFNENIKKTLDWQYDSSEKKQFAKEAKELRKKSRELREKYKYNFQEHEIAIEQARPFLEFLGGLDQNLISRGVEDTDIKGDKTTNFEKIAEAQADGSIRYCYFDRKEQTFHEDRVSFKDSQFLIFSNSLVEKMKLENIEQDFEAILSQCAKDLTNRKISYDFGYVWDRASNIISHPLLVTEGKMRDEISAKSASYGALVQALYLRNKYQKQQWPYHPRLWHLAQGISINDGGGLLIVYDRKENDQYVFRPLNQEEYKRYVKYYIYRDNDYLNVQAF